MSQHGKPVLAADGRHWHHTAGLISAMAYSQVSVIIAHSLCFLK